MKNPFFEKYAKTITAVYILIFLLRVIETALVTYNYGFDNKIVVSECFGLFMDVFGVSVLIIAYGIISFLLSKFKSNVLRVVNITLLVVLTLISLSAIIYFAYRLNLLDIFLYQYSIREILFTVTTFPINIFQITMGFVIILVVLLFAWLIDKIRFNRVYLKLLYSFVLVSLPLFFLFNRLWGSNLDEYSLNKPFYFVEESIKYALKLEKDVTVDTEKFRELYPEKEFINDNYPLVHRAKRENELGKYFNKFTTKPNIVILIVEGLNDDFIHEYKGSRLMPFLSQLKDSGLYWERCFTLGERSFAVVPSVLGGLPYGDKGFTQQKRVPRHLSLVSILNANDYYTSFYYGLGAWFYSKSRFFRYNNIDLIFDKSRFSDSYSKIIVGEDKFFWGYNDRDLFRQSLEVIDTLKQSPRLDIYFTGTSHSPFAIEDEDYYDSQLKQLVRQPYEEFYQTHSTYLKSLLFVDDALKEYFNEYKKREDYENTVFIITGDHPMTELPIKNSLKRYHVPLLIFSDKLNEPQSFTNIVSHLDISEALLSFLQDYLIHIPAISTSLGGQLICNENKSHKNIAFMNENREVIDFLSGDYYLSGDKLYYVDSLLNIEEIEDTLIKSNFEEKLNVFRNMSLYVTREDRIISKEDYSKELGIDEEW
ncbi:MAG TPA: LTA synthase family protein [Salinivirgaceae bacterium]|nr:LTA synthase family protein [Salinivirgaceae bacterium]